MFVDAYSTHIDEQNMLHVNDCDAFFKLSIVLSFQIYATWHKSF